MSPTEVERFCAWCGELIQSTNPKAKFCSANCRLEAFNAKPCVYCGSAANSRDHFVPSAFFETMLNLGWFTNSRLIVPACIECNSTAGGNVFRSMKDKRTYILEAYLRKYKKILEAPGWTQKEIDDLGYELRSHIIRQQELKQYLIKRIARLRRGTSIESYIKHKKPEQLDPAIIKLIEKLERESVAG